MINLLEAFKNEDSFTKKKFGQHFLTNKAILDKIIEAANITENDNVIEIGPGCGVLTQLITETKASTIALEIDTELMEFLNRYLFFYKNLTIINYDKIYEDKPVIIIGNLPYNVSVKIFEKAAMRKNIKNMVFMFQKEVADRIIAKPNSKAYSSLSVFTSYFFDTIKIKDISGANFWPNANVMSTVLKFVPKKEREFTGEKEQQFFKFLRHAFRQKRKTLKNNLHDIDDISSLLSQAGLINTSRAEELTLEKFKELFNITYEKHTF